jgi:hypothetical protein
MSVSALPYPFAVTTCFDRSPVRARFTVEICSRVLAARAACDGKMRSP